MPHEVKFAGPRAPQWGCEGFGTENFRCRPTCRKCENRAPARLRHDIAAAVNKAAYNNGGDGESGTKSQAPIEAEVLRLRRRIKMLPEQRPAWAADAAPPDSAMGDVPPPIVGCCKKDQ